MKLIAGLGNPGKEYENTRHNAGFMILERLTSDFRKLRSAKQFNTRLIKMKKEFESEMVKIDGLMFVKPQTFMNRSGFAVANFIKFYKIGTQDLFVIHDDLDINLGEYKIQMGKGPRIHNGLESVYEKLGTKQFWHVRVGVDTRQGERKMEGKDYVLMHFSKEEKDVFNLMAGRLVLEIIEKIKINYL
jgi:PTH1 family peptidyl-tRNA hydrolase